MSEAKDQSDFPEAKPIVLPTVQPEMDALDIIGKRNALFDRVLAVAVSATNANDWKDMGGKPYLEASGCEKAARRFGVSVYDVRQEREDLQDDNGRYYIYTTLGKACLGTEHIESIGTCSSRDKFFGMSGGRLKALQDVDVANIKKKSFTNFRGNAIRQLLGLNNLTWDMLAKMGVTKTGNVHRVEFDKGASKAANTKRAEVAESQAKKPFWTSEYNGNTYVNARIGSHFSSEFLVNLGLRAGKKEGNYYAIATEQIMSALEDEFMAAEETLAMREEGGIE